MTVTNSVNKAFDQVRGISGGLTKLEQDSLAGLDKGSPEYKRAHAQLQLQKLAEVTQFVANTMKKLHDTAMAQISVLR